MSQVHYFHFTLGPVQGFVSQARRTRDFWAGSFLLSWLSGVAMRAVIAQDGQILFPAADKDFLNYLSNKPTGKKPTQGSIPNRFKAEVNANFEPQQVIDSIQNAWRTLADIIFKEDIGKEYANPDTKAIWDQQIANSWDISWILCDDEESSRGINQRKNWRSYVHPTQAGIKCMMMANWQELSGVKSPHSEKLSQFWQPLQISKNTMQTDFREGEHLCAIAFVKRRFVRYFNKINGCPMPNGWLLSGWELKPGMPSVAYMGAAHWLAEATKTAPDQFQVFYEAAKALTGGHLDEWNTYLACHKHLQSKQEKHWRSLDGNVFHSLVLENVNTYPDVKKAKQVSDKLSELNHSINEKRRQANKKPLPPASPFYAVLMMDGDSLGKQMSKINRQQPITKSLKAFTDKVQQIVEKHNGVLIYAGGDDVLAIFPLEDALACAIYLRQYYESCFKKHRYQNDKGEEEQVYSTLSGAIEYAHIKIPLTKILYDAHHLLDDIAKDKTGRDSIAIRVQKPGGLALEWSQPWEVALDKENDRLVLETLVDKFNDAMESDATFSSKFFYKIRERFSVLNPDKDEEKKGILSNEEAIDLMCMEYLNSGKTRINTMQEAEKIIKPLLEQCRHVTRDVDEKNFDKWERSNTLDVDAALLVRFLANKGIER